MHLARRAKYALDRVAACLLVVGLSPLLAVIAAAIRLDSPGSPFFLQERIGAAGRAFTIFKFRTMRRGSEHQGLGYTTAKHDDRITRVGTFLRATSLDELPQLFNIVRGEMSFVGPRPTLRYQVERYTPEQRRRLLFRPGITGWAQVHGRNDIDWEKRIAYDLEYVEHWSLGLDLRILLRTVAVLLWPSGVYAAGDVNDDFHRHPGPIAAAPAEGSPGAAPARLLVIGAGGHARVIVDIAEKQSRYRVAGLVDERPELRGTAVLGYPILGGRDVLEGSDLPVHAVVAIGAPDARADWQDELERRGFELATLIHPSAQVGRDVFIDAGTVLMAGAIVNPGSRLGRGVIVNTGASIDHDCVVGDFVHVAPGARLAGGVRVGARAHIGIGACVLQGVEIGAGAIVGAGAAVVHDVPPAQTVVGVPARALRRAEHTAV